MKARKETLGASIIVGGSFGLDPGYAVYFPESGLLQFLFAGDAINTDEHYDGLGGQWDLIVPGGFWTPDEEDYKFRDGRFSSLLFYDRDAGLGEFFLHSPFEVGTDPAYANRTATKMYRTTPLRALWQHPPYFHDGSAPDLPAVVNHYNTVFKLGLRDREKADLVEYLKTL